MNQFLHQSRFIIAAIAGASVVAFSIWEFAKRRRGKSPPTKWKKVGEITDLLCYPIKSAGCIQLEEFNCHVIGLEKDNIRDRVFMVVTTAGEFVTARKYPKLVLITPVIHDDTMALSAPEMPQILINFDVLRSRASSKAEVWGQSVKVIDAGDIVAQWFSKYVLGEESGLRLVYYPQLFPTRDVREKNKVFESAIKDDTGALHDATSFMLINEASLEELNSRIETQVSPLRFRPNIVVKGPGAYEEDDWDWIKIGSEVVFQNVKPCTRCGFTTIDPETSIRDPNHEPLKTLKTYRKIEKGGDSPVMGIHLGLRVNGKIKLHDPIYIEDKQ